jgi:hypothetical protein
MIGSLLTPRAAAGTVRGAMVGVTKKRGTEAPPLCLAPAQRIFKFSADSLPRFATTSKLTFAPSAKPV